MARYIFQHLVVPLTALFLLIASLALPHYDWDLAGHLGSAFAWHYSEPSEIHSATYNALSASVKPVALDKILTGNDDRKIWASDADAFMQVLPFYQPRVLLTVPTSIAISLGIDPVRFIQLYTSISVALGMLLFGMLFLPYLSRSAILALPIVALLTGTLETARFEGADAIAFGLFGWFAFSFANKSKLCLFPLLLLPMARSDMALLVFCFLPLLKFQIRISWLHIATCALAVLIAYFFVSHYFGNYGWAMQFYVVHVNYLARPAEADIQITFSVYLNSLLKGLALLIYNKSFLFFVFSCFFIVGNFYNNLMIKFPSNIYEFMQEKSNALYCLCFVSILFVIGHFLIFPLAHTRYFSAQYLCVGLMLLYIYSNIRDLRR